MSTAIDLLDRYLARKWQVVPVHTPGPATGACSCGKECGKPGKHPVAAHWPGGSTDHAHFAGRNIGVQLGPDSQDLADVDLDCNAALAAAPYLLPRTECGFGRGGAQTHWLYTVGDKAASFLRLEDPTLPGNQATIIELRWPEWDEKEQRYKALQTVIPPSLHHTGKTLEWMRDGAPTIVPGAELVAVVKSIGAAVLIARHTQPKKRHDLVLLIANLLVRAGWTEDDKNVKFMLAVFEARKDADKAAKIADGEGPGAVEDARKRLKAGKKMTGLPKLREMLNPDIEASAAEKVVALIKVWLGVPDPLQQTVGDGTTRRGGSGAPAAPARPVAPIPPFVPFPTHLLPSVLRAYIEATAAAMNCDASYCALPALAALGAAIGASHVASPKKGWKEPPYVWALPIGKSGAIKSPPYREVENAAEDINDRLEEIFQAEMLQYESDLVAWEDARKQSKNGGPDAGPRPRPPVKRAFIKGDVTIEALVGALQDNPRGLLIGQDELSAWIGSFVKYAGKTGASDLPRWLQLHHAGTINYTRKTGDPDRREVRVRGVGVSVTGTIQPKVLSRVLTDEFRSSGFLARLLLAMPPWRKRQWTEAEVDEPTREAFAELLECLYSLPAGSWPNGRPCPHLVRLSDEAKRMFIAFYDANGTALETADEDMSAVMSKLEGYALRFALIFHCCRLKEYAKEAKISSDDMASAVALTGWFRDEAERVYLALAEPLEVQGARHLADVVRKLAERSEGRVTPRALQRFNCRKYPNAQSAAAALEGLVGLGFGRWEEMPSGDRGGPPTRAYAPCMTHDTTDLPDEDGATDDCEENGELHDTTSQYVPAIEVADSGPNDVSNSTISDCGETVEHASTVVSCVSYVMQGHQERGDMMESSPSAGGGLCHAKGVVSCTWLNSITSADGIRWLADLLKGWHKPVGLDTETTGLDPTTDRVRLIQVALGEDVAVIDLFAFGDPADSLASLFTALAGKEIIGHNLQFDLRMLARLGFTPERVFDTMIASRVLYAGERGVNSARLKHSLEETASRELGRQLDKSLQDSDWSGPLTPAQLAYAAADAKVLVPLAEALKAKLTAAGSDAIAELEMQALPGVAWCGRVTVNATAWTEQARAAEAELARVQEHMDALAPNPACLPGTESRNWNSTDDVRSAFLDLGMTLDSTDDGVLAAIEHPLASLVRDFRGLSKQVGTYGRAWLEKHLDQNGRVLPSWNQLGTDSGRMSCSDPNLQQIPRGSDYCSCFIAAPGKVLVKADYSQIELRIAAKIADEQVMIRAYQEGGDLHRLTAARVLDKPETEVTKTDRQIAKSLNFGFLYGMGWRGLRAYALANYGVNLSDDQARAYREAFFRAYPGLRAWHRRVGDAVDRQFKSDPSGTFEVWTLGGRRRALPVARKRRDGTVYPSFNDALNAPVQGTGADGLKSAIARLWETRAECPSAVPVIYCHDEIVMEVAEADAGRAEEWLKRCMIEAVAPLINPVPVEVEVTEGRSWGG